MFWEEVQFPMCVTLSRVLAAKISLVRVEIVFIPDNEAIRCA
jgi:hypothetical protein